MNCKIKTALLFVVFFVATMNTFSQTEFTPYDEYSNYLSNTLIETFCILQHPELCEEGAAPGGVDVKVCYFKPTAWEYDFAYCQINYYGDNETEFTHVFFWPDDNGNLSSERYSLLIADDLPYADCQIIEIKSVNYEMIGKFKHYGKKGEETAQHLMHYNFNEMFLSWVK